MRDIILMIGPFATGKTYTRQYLQSWANEHNIPYEEELLSDNLTILKNMEKDDARGGFYHYHSWCLGNTNGHTHSSGKSKLPFIAYGNEILDGTYKDLFEKM